MTSATKREKYSGDSVEPPTKLKPRSSGRVTVQDTPRAHEANDALLASKILNYRAVNQLNQHHDATAMRLALQANQARAQLARDPQGRTGNRISASDASSDVPP